MSPQIHEFRDNVKTLSAGVADNLESKATGIYDEVRKGVSHALEHGKDAFGSACKRALDDSRSADRMMHKNLYQTIFLGIGAGILLGYLCARRNTFNCD